MLQKDKRDPRNLPVIYTAETGAEGRGNQLFSR